ncbi:D-Ala-D-Ala carboxypeptidase family metallohydrolase [uncultured Pseudacidovorax sp.]|uniref:D-Ala-D-Ala carboxypeptidase family metallohydrolase n=1 Tax=uncultured Pseudacidovorax sp. TaxID=679313 RepID=UPI0025E856DF|nr:D-Ala-D-Ala carboxypeptidase family metallohydrolase [uncultured Pseudacidovorax sp.]
MGTVDLTTKLAANFSLGELVSSAKADSLGIDNTPPAAIVEQLRATAAMLQRIRDRLDRAVIVTSGYRCQALNRAVGGVTSSDHVQGQAADILVPGYGTPYDVAKALAPLVSMLGIGQLILEGVGGKRWVHVSTRVPDRPANRVITITDAGTQLGIQPVR